MLQYPVRPMLAQLHPPPEEGHYGYPFTAAPGTWRFEPKYNGHRLVCRQTTSGDVILWSRSGREVTFEYPEVVVGVRELLGSAGPLVLDGEVVAWVGHKESPGHLGTQKRKLPGVFLQYVVFDVLARGQDLLAERPLADRLDVLDDLFDVRNPDKRVKQGTSTTNGQALWEAVLSTESEGIVAKPASSRYIEDERGVWLKIKRNEREVLWVVGYTTGERSRAPLFGALILARWDGKEFRYAGKCGTGNYSDRVSAEMQDLMDSHQTGAGPFLGREAELAKRKIASGTRDVVWLTPTLRAVIEFADKSTDGIPQFPSWKSWYTE